MPQRSKSRTASGQTSHQKLRYCSEVHCARESITRRTGTISRDPDAAALNMKLRLVNTRRAAPCAAAASQAANSGACLRPPLRHGNQGNTCLSLKFGEATVDDRALD